jgi:hypothetical protein
VAAYVPVCSVDPGAGNACSSGDLSWVDVQTLSALPELTPTEIGQLAAAFLVLFAVAVSIRFLIKQFTK